MRRLLALIAFLLAPALSLAQPAPTTFGWSDLPVFAQAGITYELETLSGQLVPCVEQPLVGAERRCRAGLDRTVPQTVRLRGRLPTCDPDGTGPLPPATPCLGAWSADLAVPPGAVPGLFTIHVAVPGVGPPVGAPMSVRVNGGDRFSRTTNLPPRASTTFGGWVKRTGTIGGFDCLMSLEASGGADGVWIGFQSGSLHYYTGAGNGAFTSGTLYNSVWSYVAFTINNNTLTIYARREGEASLVSLGSISVTSFTEATLWFASDSGPEDLDGELRYGRIWDAVLNGTELQAESESTTAVRTSNLNASYAFAAAASATTDSSGNGRTLSLAGTALDGASEPTITVGGGGVATIDSWGPHYPDLLPRRIARPMPTGTITPQNFAAPAAPALSWHPSYPTVPALFRARALPAALRLAYTADKLTAPAAPSVPALSWAPLYPTVPGLFVRRARLAALYPTFTIDPRYSPPAAPSVVPLSWKPTYPDVLRRARTAFPAAWPFRSSLSPTAHIVVVVPPGSTTYAEWLGEVVTDRTVLCEIQPAEALSGFAAVGGGTPNTYSIAWANVIDAATVPGGVYRRLDDVRLNGAALTLRGSIGAVDANLGSYFYDATAAVLYVSTPTASDPDTFAAVAAFFSFFFATAPKDFVGGQLWEPRLTGELPTVSATVEDPFTPGKTVADGSIVLVNAGAPFDRWAKRYVWKNKKATLRLGGGLLTEAQYEAIQTMRIESIAVNDDKATLTVRTMASSLEQTLPLHTFGLDEYPRMADGVEGTYKPLLYGLVRNIPAPCVDAFIKAYPDPAAWPASGFADVYLVADPAVQVLTSVLAVTAVNKNTGEVNALDPTQYSVNLAACTVTVAAAIVSSHEWDIRIDATGETDGAGGYLDTFGEIAKDVLTLLGETSSTIEASTFAAADLAAPFALGLWVREGQAASEVLSILQQSVLGGLWIDRAGKWRAMVLDASTDPAAVATLEDFDFASWAQVDRIDPVYPTVRLYYAQNPAAGTWPVTTASDAATQYLNETSDGLNVYTALVSSSDATIIAQRYRLLSSAPDVWIDTDQRGLGLMTAEPYDRLLVTRARAPHVSGSFGPPPGGGGGGASAGQRMEILGYEKRLSPAGIRVRLGDLSGIADLIDLIRAWADDSIPVYTSASALEQDTYAFWHDDNDEVTPAVGPHSVWW